MENEEIEQQIAALENEVDQIDEEIEQEEVEEVEETEEPFDLDAALDGLEAVNLDGKITDDEAIEAAKKRGWNEKGVDKFGHHVSAKEFLERTPFFRTIDRMRERQDKLNSEIENLKQQNQQIAAKSLADKEKLRQELKEEREKLLNQDFLDENDVKRARQINKELDQVEPEQKNGADPEIVKKFEESDKRFKSDNDWYGSDHKMTTTAEEIGVAYCKTYFDKHGVLPDPDEMHSHVLSEVKSIYPSKFMKKPTRVTQTGTRVVTNNQKQKKTLNDIPQEVRALAQEVMEATGMSAEQYLKTYKG